MALGSTQSLVEMSTRRPERKADNLTAVCEPIFYKLWESRRSITAIALLTYPLPVSGEEADILWQLPYEATGIRNVL
jgi:hypothetical protein